MKKFIDLEAGDEVYVLTVDVSSRAISTKIVHFSCYTGFINGMFTAYFKDTSETVRLNSQECKQEFKPIGDHKYTYYFSDRLEVEKFLKEEIEKSRDYIRNLEMTYSTLWIDKEEPPKEPEKKSESSNEFIWEKGDAIYVVAFESVGLFDGNGNLYFADGDKIDIKEAGYLKNLRKANSMEIADYFEIVKSRIAHHEGLVANKIRENICSCGYKFEGNTPVKLL